MPIVLHIRHVSTSCGHTRVFVLKQSCQATRELTSTNGMYNRKLHNTVGIVYYEMGRETGSVCNDPAVQVLIHQHAYASSCSESEGPRTAAIPGQD